MAKLRKAAAPSGGGFTPSPFWDARAGKRPARASRTNDLRAGCSFRCSLYETSRESPAQRNLRHFSACFPEIPEPLDVASTWHAHGESRTAR